MHLTLVMCGMTAADSKRTQFTVFYLLNFGVHTCDFSVYIEW
jgi:hypothetical protein